MNDTLQKIMLFINDNTLILIGICVFLILVLIGYLIDNSVKSKRVRNDIKNADQVPENIKDEIIKKAEEKKEMEDKTINIIENEPVKDPNMIVDSGIIEDEVNSLNDNQTIKNDTSEDLNASLSLDNVQQSNDDISSSLNLDSSFEINEQPVLESENDNIADLNIESQDILINNDEDINITTDLINESVDPDYNIMNSQSNSEYNNDKKLSEILFQSDIKQTVEDDSNIFSDNTSNIVINNDVKKDDVQIEESQESSDELDRIMKKLSSMNNSTEEDNYTNIF